MAVHIDELGTMDVAILEGMRKRLQYKDIGRLPDVGIGAKGVQYHIYAIITDAYRKVYPQHFESLSGRAKTRKVLSLYLDEKRGGAEQPSRLQSRRKAYDVDPPGHMLRRERLSKEDMETGRAVKPRGVCEIAQALAEGRSVAVQGLPGSGKSALAAWVHWLTEKKGRPVSEFRGRELRREDPAEVCRRFEAEPSDRILLVDDIHLLMKAMARINSYAWSAERRFFLLGRAPYVGEALNRGEVPKIHESLTEIKPEDSSAIAEDLAKKFVDDITAQRVLEHSGKDLVLTKWLLEGVFLDDQPSDFTPMEAAIGWLNRFRKAWGGEDLRLFLTLAAFGWLELRCPESILCDDLGFEIDTIEGLQEPIHEADRQMGTAGPGDYSIGLMRHPKLCELFLDAAPELGRPLLRKHILEPTYDALGLPSPRARSCGLAPLVLGIALERQAADLLSIEWPLVYSGRLSEYVDVIKTTVELLQARHGMLPNTDLPLEEKERRLELAFAACNGERRRHGGIAARAMLEDLQQKLGVPEIPPEPFARKGFLLYQDAYLLRLHNAGQAALDRFGESAAAEEEWASAQGSPLHYGKAVQSRSAAATYRIDLAAFAGSTPTGLRPDRVHMGRVSEDLSDGLKRLQGLLSSELAERERQELERYRRNALLILAEASGWLGDKSAVETCLTALGAVTQLDEWSQLLVTLARGALAFAEGQHRRAIAELEGQPENCFKLKGGENGGKIAVMLLVSHLQVGDRAKARTMQRWLLSEQCAADSGNGVAKTWAAMLQQTGM